ncbi:hypothetical protein GF367_02345 [Candidatus Woesearchaeota archaeon]|nr:hypothetical protein [Candidatus Woesearchaeota archaeon]
MTSFDFILLVIGGAVLLWLGYALGKQLGRLMEKRRWEQRLPNIREEAAKRSRAVLGGQFSEQLAPFLPDFPWQPTEARFLGKPIDFLVFKGLDEKHVEKIIFVEVKSGGSRLNTAERSLRDAVQEKKVSWQEYRIPDDLTAKKP